VIDYPETGSITLQSRKPIEARLPQGACTKTKTLLPNPAKFQDSPNPVGKWNHEPGRDGKEPVEYRDI
jgi:hypothetical protein